MQIFVSEVNSTQSGYEWSRYCGQTSRWSSDILVPIGHCCSELTFRLTAIWLSGLPIRLQVPSIDPIEWADLFNFNLQRKFSADYANVV